MSEETEKILSELCEKKPKTTEPKSQVPEPVSEPITDELDDILSEYRKLNSILDEVEEEKNHSSWLPSVPVVEIKKEPQTMPERVLWASPLLNEKKNERRNLPKPAVEYKQENRVKVCLPENIIREKENMEWSDQFGGASSFLKDRILRI